jgi:hypothetical protein
MPCKDSSADANNALHAGNDDSMPTLTVAYGPYIN